MCGGTYPVRPIDLCSQGLSPRVRGNPHSAGTGRQTAGSIPACAGEPDLRPGGVRRAWVYPRVCGGTLLPRWGVQASEGLSPRVRGNRAGTGLQTAVAGSIPACAGEPRRRNTRPRRSRVYPRVCGGTRVHGATPIGIRGLSPRVRGNRRKSPACRAGSGSIPACAGEPEWSWPFRDQPGVYPRVCGGTKPGADLAIV